MFLKLFKTFLANKDEYFTT